MIWALRSERLTGDTAGYGQIVPLVETANSNLQMMWHAAAGAIAAPFSPVFMGQTTVPLEYGPHRFLTAGEAHRFEDLRHALGGGVDTVSAVSQLSETTLSAFQESKRLLYLLQNLGKTSLARVHDIFERRETEVARMTEVYAKVAEAGLKAHMDEEVCEVLEAFSRAAMASALKLVTDLTCGLSAEVSELQITGKERAPVSFSQIW